MRRDRGRLRLVLALLLLTSFTLLTLDVRSGRSGPLRSLREGVSSVLSPVGDVLGAGLRPIGDALAAGAHAGRDKDRRRALERQVLDLRRQLAAQAQAQADATQLAGLADLELRGNLRLVPATVSGLGSPVEDFREAVTIDVGTADGVKIDSLVVSKDGLVGRIARADAQRSLVVLLTDESFTKGVQLADDPEQKQLATVTGAGRGQLLSFSLADRSRPLKVGARLVTYPGGSIEGIPVGQVDTVTTAVGGLAQTATVRPYADLQTLDVLGVVVSQDRDHPRSALSPAPSPPAAAPVAPSGSASPSAAGPSATGRSAPTGRAAPTGSATPTRSATTRSATPTRSP